MFKKLKNIFQPKNKQQYIDTGAYQEFSKENLIELYNADGQRVYVVQWDRVNTLAFRRTLEYIVCHGVPSRIT